MKEFLKNLLGSFILTIRVGTFMGVFCLAFGIFPSIWGLAGGLFIMHILQLISIWGVIFQGKKKSIQLALMKARAHRTTNLIPAYVMLFLLGMCGLLWSAAMYSIFIYYIYYRKIEV